MRAAASVDRLNMMGEGNSGRKLPSMPDSTQRSPLKISGREGEIAAIKRSNRRSASSQNLVHSADGERLFLFFLVTHFYKTTPRQISTLLAKVSFIGNSEPSG